MSLKQQIQDDMKQAMRDQDKSRLATVRLLLAAIKQYEVDNREEADDERVLALLDKQAKQRRESIEQYKQAKRDDLIAIEQAELEIIQHYLPEALSQQEIDDAIKAAIAASGAESIKDMGKVMAELKPKLQGRADLSEVSRQVRQLLS